MVIFVTNLTTCADHGYDTNFIVTDNQVPRAVNNFRSHPSIIMIKNKKKKKNDQSHSSGPVIFDDVLERGADRCVSGGMFPSDLELQSWTGYLGQALGFMSNSAMRWTPWPCILSLKSFDNTWSKSYIPCLLLIKMLRFTCGEKKIFSNIKKVSKYCDYDCSWCNPSLQIKVTKVQR